MADPEKYRALEKIRRPDITKLLRMNKEEFSQWIGTRREVTEYLLEKHKIFGSIPNLRSIEENHNMDKAGAVIDGYIHTLKEGLEYLDALETFYNQAHPE